MNVLDIFVIGHFVLDIKFVNVRYYRQVHRET